MDLNERILGWGSILTLGLTILGSILRALTCPSVEKPYSLAGQIFGTPYIIPRFPYNAHVVDPSTNCSMTVWSLKSGRIFASRENFQLIIKYICSLLSVTNKRSNFCHQGELAPQPGEPPLFAKSNITPGLRMVVGSYWSSGFWVVFNSCWSFPKSKMVQAWKCQLWGEETHKVKALYS